MKYSKIVPGGVYERPVNNGVERATMVSAKLRSCGTVTGMLHPPGVAPIYVADNHNGDNWDTWRYVGGGVAFEGFSLPDTKVDGVQQAEPPKGSAYSDLPAKTVLGIAHRKGISSKGRELSDVIADLEALGA